MIGKNKQKSASVKVADHKPAKPSNNKRNGILGLLLLLVVMSIAYSTYVVWFGTTGITPKVLLIPQMIFAAVVLVQKFNK